MEERGSPTAFQAARELRSALRRLQKPAQLQESPLAQTALVRDCARQRYQEAAYPEGLALRQLLIETIAEVDCELASPGESSDNVDCKKQRLVLRGLARGEGVRTVARSMGLVPNTNSSRELYKVQHMLVRSFLQRAGQMAAPQPARGRPVTRAS